MKTQTKNLFVLPALIIGLGLILSSRSAAQTFTILHIFTATSDCFCGTSTNSDGIYPQGGLTLSGNILYGTAEYGGASGNGTVFAINTDGTGFRTLHSFSAMAGLPGPNSDGAVPMAGLLLSGNTLYGTAVAGGSAGLGVLFAVGTDGTGFTNLHSFTGADGVNPEAGLILSGNTLYGTTHNGGNATQGAYGTVFAINTDGTGFTNLHSFVTFNGTDGMYPDARLVLSGSTLYGTAIDGGSHLSGTVFAVNTNGTGFKNLYSFGPTHHSTNIYYGVLSTNSDGANPNGLILLGNTLYGTTSSGGISGFGTLFAINTDGTGFTNLHSFTINQGGPLTVWGDTLYGPAGGGVAVYAIKTTGAAFTFLLGGTAPYLSYGNLVLMGTALYGIGFGGGSLENGLIFSLSVNPQLTITPAGQNVILSWPTNFAGFDYTGCTLQATTNLASPIWTTNLTSPVVVNGQITVTNPLTSPQQFFRLKCN